MNQQGASFSSVLQKLASDHFSRVISQTEYRSKRREILDQIDQYYNGSDPRNRAAEGKDPAQAENRDATTVPDQNPLGTTMTFSVDEIVSSNDPSNERDKDE